MTKLEAANKIVEICEKHGNELNGCKNCTFGYEVGAYGMKEQRCRLYDVTKQGPAAWADVRGKKRI